MQVTVKQGQTIFDIAIQTAGSVEAAFSAARLNGMGITDDLTVGDTLISPPVIDKRMLRHYNDAGIVPATATVTNYPVYSEPALDLPEVFAGGMAYPFPPLTVSEVLALFTDTSPSPFVLKSPKKGSRFNFIVPQGTMTVCIVCPPHLTPSKIYNMNFGYSVEELFIEHSQMIFIDGRNFVVYYYTAPVPLAGAMRLEVTL